MLASLPDVHTDSLLPLIQARYADFVADLRELVSIDCGSWHAAGVDEVGDWCAGRLSALGFDVTRERVGTLGRPVWGRRLGGNPEGARILLMAHMDTVFEVGEATRRPFTVDGDIARGPGVCDDKAGLLAGLYAVQALLDAGFTDYAELLVHCSPDEEIGSPGSRSVIQRLASTVDYALCLECARANGDIVSGRKGIADLTVTVTGRAAHSGIEPEKGINAALEAAYLIIALQALNGRWPGVSVNVGAVQAGTRPNIVCPSAILEVELRAATVSSFEVAYAEVGRILATPTVPGAVVEVERTVEHVPWERSPAVVALVNVARAVGAELSINVRDATTGGAADANITAALGVPTLDGLGPVGGNDHSPQEYLDLPSVVPRIALLAGVIARLGGQPTGLGPVRLGANNRIHRTAHPEGQRERPVEAPATTVDPLRRRGRPWQVPTPSRDHRGKDEEKGLDP